MKFSSGKIVATPAAYTEVGWAVIDGLLNRHFSGDYGTLENEDKRANDQAVTDGGRILSAYDTPEGSRVWIITDGASGDEGNTREVTTVLLPDEY